MIKLIDLNKEVFSGRPDIFRAARNNDLAELEAALKEGQSLDDQSSDDSNMTPVHLACYLKHIEFMHEAVKHSFNPWILDHFDNRAIDIARINGFKSGQKAILEKMKGTPFPRQPSSFEPD